MKIEEIYNSFCATKTISTDSRKIEPNSIFFALKGENFNGNKFALKAIEQGAKLAIIDEEEYNTNEKCILVNDVLLCLQELANFHRKTLNIPILAITGTNGKTTTKELIKAVLSTKYNCSATKGNLNNHIGVPLTLLDMTSDTEFGIVEMGANHPKEIEFLCQIAEPNYAIVTNVGKAHLEGFGSFQGVKNTKKELYDYIKAKKGEIFINSGNTHLSEMMETYEKSIYYGACMDDFCKANYIQSSPYMIFELLSKTGKLYVKTKLFGKYNFENALAAACIGKFFDIDIITIKSALEKYQPQNNRSQLRKTEKNILFLDAYNANPSSMELAINNFVEMNIPNKIYILGDMLELGNDSKKEHLKIINFFQEKNISKVFFVGNIFNNLNKDTNFVSTENVDQLRNILIEQNLSGKSILIKGSRGIALEKCIDIL